MDELYFIKFANITHSRAMRKIFLDILLNRKLYFFCIYMYLFDCFLSLGRVVVKTSLLSFIFVAKT